MRSRRSAAVNRGRSALVSATPSAVRDDPARMRRRSPWNRLVDWHQLSCRSARPQSKFAARLKARLWRADQLTEECGVQAPQTADGAPALEWLLTGRERVSSAA